MSVLRTDVTAGEPGHAALHNEERAAINLLSAVTGAAGDGIVDDTTAIQAALTAGAGGVVTLPAGTFLSGRLTIPARTWLRGAGQGATILKLKNGYNADFITNTNGASDITITDLSVNGNKANQTSGAQCRGIYLLSCARLLIDRVHVYDVEGHGIHLSNTGTVEGQRVSNCLLERAGSNPIATYGSNIAATNATDLLITNTVSLDSAKAGFRLAGSGINLAGCVARRNGNGGIVTVSGENTGITVTGGVYSDNGITAGIVAQSNADGIRLVGVKNAELNSVKCSNNQGAGVGIYNSSTHVNISGGQYRNNGQYGGVPGAVEGRDGICVVGNTSLVTDITLSGVQCYDDQTTKTQQYGIRLRNLVDFVLIAATNTRGNKTAGYLNAATGATTITTSAMIGAA